MPDVLKPDAYKILNNEIKRRGLKANFVAKQIGISPNYFSQVMNGSRNLSSDVAIRASQVLGLPLDIFLNKS